MKFLKILSWLVALIVVLAVAAGVYLYLNLNTIVERVVESVGSDLTHTPVTLRKVDISLTEGRGELQGFSIGNPAGYSSDNIFQFEQFVVQIDPASVTKDVIVINEITVMGLSMNAEEVGGRTNIQQLADNLGGGGASTSDTAESGEASNVRLMVEKLKFADGSIQVLSEKLGNKTVNFPSFELLNLGDKSKGLTPEELGLKVLKELSNRAKRAVEKELKQKAKDELKSKAKEKLNEQLDEKTEKKLKKLKELL